MTPMFFQISINCSHSYELFSINLSDKKKIDLQNHCEPVHNFCAMCQETFASRGEILDHLKAEHNRDFQCVFCFVRYFTKKPLDKHCIKNHKEKKRIN